ncbi:type II toxin-antitoxin system YhaV family toxin [Desulfocurvus sp. DL9XJH121]
MPGGWGLFFYRYFDEQYKLLVDDVKALRAKDPKGYKQHPLTKFLAKVHRTIFERVPRDPAHKEFLLGNTLGKKYRHWRRAKNDLPHRHRLFFQFSSGDKRIIYCWLNDSNSLRRAGAQNDVYAVFQRLLESSEIPNKYEQLLKFASPCTKPA